MIIKNYWKILILNKVTIDRKFYCDEFDPEIDFVHLIISLLLFK